jgi:integrase
LLVVTPDGAPVPELVVAVISAERGRGVGRRLVDVQGLHEWWAIPASLARLRRHCSALFASEAAATWLVDDAVPVNMVQRVLGHERSSTTLGLHTRRTDDPTRVLRALDDPDEPSTVG